MEKVIFWSRQPGQFVNKRTGEGLDVILNGRPGPNFTGTAQEWNETLIEATIDLANQLHKDAVQHIGACNKNAVEVRANTRSFTMYEGSILFRPFHHNDVNERSGTVANMKIVEDNASEPFEPRLRANFVSVDGRAQVTLEGKIKILG